MNKMTDEERNQKRVLQASKPQLKLELVIKCNYFNSKTMGPSLIFDT